MPYQAYSNKLLMIFKATLSHTHIYLLCDYR